MNLQNEYPAFVILLVDDHPGGMKSHMNRIINFLGKKKHRLELIISKDGEKVESGETINEVLLKKAVDVVAVDYNIKQGKGGINVIKKIQRENHLVDILFYSTKKNIKKVLDTANTFRYTEVIKGRKIAPALERLIVKSLKKWEDVFFLRGYVISKMIDLEVKMNDFFEKYFQMEKHQIHFKKYVVENKFISFEAKKSTIVQIIKKEEWDIEISGLLGELQNDRNNLAHCKKDPNNTSHFISMGEGIPYGRKEIIDIFERVVKASEKLDNLIKKLK